MHAVVFALIGGLLGATVPNGDVAGFAAGAALGVLVAWIGRLQSRIAKLELDAAARPAAMPHGERAGKLSASAQSKTAVEQPPGARATPRIPSPKRSRLLEETAPSVLERAFSAIAGWFTSGNVPVKVGVVLSVFGVGFLVKEAVDRNWISIPLELRLIFVALFALVLLAVGWRLRERNRAYAVSVQGGGIAMLYVTIYASFAVYGLLPAGVAFTMLFAVTVTGATLAVMQDARALAVLGMVGGFLAPLLTSSGSGNHVVLFSYYAVLDLAIFGIAWFKAWRALNLLGFFFTFGIATVWGIDAYRPELFASTEPFLVLFVALYTLIPVLFAFRSRPELKGFVDGTLVFGTPLVAFGLQSQLVGDTRYGLAISALVLAAVYFTIAWQLFRRKDEDLRVLAEAEVGLGAAFLALAFPLALDGRWTSAAWAAQGAAMTWLGLRQHRPLAMAAGTLLQVAAAVSLVGYGVGASGAEQGLISGTALGGLMIALAGLFSSRCLDRSPWDRIELRDAAAWAYLVWGTLWWLAAGLLEIDRHLPAALEPDAALMLIGVTVLAATFAAPYLDWPRLNAVGFLATAAIVLGALVSPLVHSHPLARWGFAAWSLLLTAHYAFLRLREAEFPSWRGTAHVSSYLAIAWLLALEAGWLVRQAADGAWPVAAMLAVVAGFVLLTLVMRERIAWPIAEHRADYVAYACGGTLALLVAATIAANVVSSGDPRPLPYVPIANPLEIASVLVLVVAYRWWRAACEVRPVLGARPERAALAFALLGLGLLTTAVARAVHHLGGVPFELEQLAESTILQAALSIVWGTAALGGMMHGARSGRREVWLAGAALMAIVVAKLFVVELGNAGTVGRVVSFLGVGVLLLVVGYFAPVPPRATLERHGA